jgi:hypothetical protein
MSKKTSLNPNIKRKQPFISKIILSFKDAVINSIDHIIK